MDKDIKVYKQRGNTCAIACMMMVLEYYKIIQKANWYDEKRLYKIYRSQFIDGTPFSALAYHFSKNRLKTTLYHEDLELFNNCKNEMDDDIFNLLMEEYKEYLKRAIISGTNVINGIKINSKLIRKELKKENIVIVAGEISGIYHAILISGYNGYDFIVCDPLYKNKKFISSDELNSFMDTSIGKWFISINENIKNNK